MSQTPEARIPDLPAPVPDRSPDPDDPFSIRGLRTVITGASRGLGRALALGFHGAGARVALLARGVEGLHELAADLAGTDADVLTLPTDVSDAAAVDGAFAAVHDRWGGIDVLINNAGTNIRSPLAATTDATWRTVLSTNLDAAFYCARAAARSMIQAAEEKGGRIVFIGSVAGHVAIPTGVAYGASKAALEQMARGLAQELGPHRITVNCVAPWYFRTPLTEALLDDPAYLARIKQATPLRRTGEDRDLVGLCRFLASGASAYLTGQTIALDGGMSTSNFAAPIDDL